MVSFFYTGENVKLSGLLEMKNLAPETRGCRFPWEVDSLTYHSRCFYDLISCSDVNVCHEFHVYVTKMHLDTQ